MSQFDQSHSVHYVITDFDVLPCPGKIFRKLKKLLRIVFQGLKLSHSLCMFFHGCGKSNDK